MWKILICFVCKIHQLNAFKFLSNCNMLDEPLLTVENGIANFGCEADEEIRKCILMKRNGDTPICEISSTVSNKWLKCNSAENIFGLISLDLKKCEFSIVEFQTTGKTIIKILNLYISFNVLTCITLFRYLSIPYNAFISCYNYML